MSHTRVDTALELAIRVSIASGGGQQVRQKLGWLRYALDTPLWGQGGGQHGHILRVEVDPRLEAGLGSLYRSMRAHVDSFAV